MHKIVTYCLICTAMLASCSGSRKLAGAGSPVATDNRKILTYGDIQEAGSGKSGFYIKKAVAGIESDGEVDKVTIILRKNTENEYLASIRSRTGIEGARVFLSRDTLLVNDRINKMLICARPESMKKLYGFSSWMIPLLFGDIFVGNSSATPVDCKDNTIDINVEENNTRISYIVDCKDYNPVSTVIETKDANGSLTIDFGKFRKYGNNDFPYEIRLTDKAGKFVVNLRIEDVELPWDGSIEFIPGEKYEIVEFR